MAEKTAGTSSYDNGREYASSANRVPPPKPLPRIRGEDKNTMMGRTANWLAEGADAAVGAETPSAASSVPETKGMYIKNNAGVGKMTPADKASMPQGQTKEQALGKKSRGVYTD